MDKYSVTANDGDKFMMAILNYNNSGGYISFEGNFENYNFEMLYGYVDKKHTLLSRNCMFKSGFLVFDLSKISLNSILQILKTNIYHVKICDNNKLLFEAYDHFLHCFLDTTFYSINFINELIDRNVIEYN